VVSLAMAVMDENKTRLSPKTSFLSGLFGGRKGYRVPVGNPTSIVCVELMERVGIYFPEAHLNARLMAELAAAGHEILDYDTIISHLKKKRRVPDSQFLDFGRGIFKPNSEKNWVEREIRKAGKAEKAGN